MSDKKIKVTLVKSVIGTKQSHRATVRGLGFATPPRWSCRIPLQCGMITRSLTSLSVRLKCA
jgi:hypothetical protein